MCSDDELNLNSHRQESNEPLTQTTGTNITNSTQTAQQHTHKIYQTGMVLELRTQYSRQAGVAVRRVADLPDGFVCTAEVPRLMLAGWVTYDRADTVARLAITIPCEAHVSACLH